MYTLFIETNYDASEAVGCYEVWEFTGNPAFTSFTWNSTKSGYFYPETTNYTSDPVTIVEARLTF